MNDLPLYPENLSTLRKNEFSHLKDSVYLDHAGSTLYANSQITQYAEDLRSNLYGNPHSANASSEVISDIIYQTRCSVLSHFNSSLEEYDVIFTNGATDAVKILSSTFGWIPGSSKFAYLEDNHTSVVGIREVASVNNSSSFCLCLTKNSGKADPFSLSLYQPTNVSQNAKHSCSNHSSKCINLFAYSAQSNFSGCRYPLDWIHQVRKYGMPCITDQYSYGSGEEIWTILLDAASFLSTSPLDLNEYSPDFVCLSFYKLFGFPTGLGALLVRKNASKFLNNKVYFGGGTVEGYLARENFSKQRSALHDRYCDDCSIVTVMASGSSREQSLPQDYLISTVQNIFNNKNLFCLEDGTLPFLDILALKHGFDFLYKAINKSMLNVRNHTFVLAQKLHAELSRLKHENDEPLTEVYSYSDFSDDSKQGPIVAFNLKRADGSYIGFNHVLHLASSCNIHLRGGCFCNVGACMSMIGIDSENLKLAYQSGHTCGGDVDLWKGQPLGALRASFGYMSVEEDVTALIKFLKDCFVTTDDQEIYYDASSQFSQLRLKEIYVYPVKSCRGMKVSKWPLCATGLKYDRMWMIVNEHGAVLTLKREYRLSLIQPFVDLQQETLTFEAKGFLPIQIPVNFKTAVASTTVNSCHTKVCGDRVLAYDCGEEIACWLSDVLGKTARLLFKPYESLRSKSAQKTTGVKPPALALTNEAQYLLLSESSVEYLHAAMVKRSSDGASVDVNSLIRRFRCNFVVAGSEPFAEEFWSEIAVLNSTESEDIHFQCSGLCNRCSMICVNSITGEKEMEPLRTLGTLPLPNDVDSLRRTTFGIYLRSTNSSSSISVGNIFLPKIVTK